MIRTFDQKDLEILAECGSVPVINGLTDTYHPVQALADVQTIYEHKGTLEHQKLAFVGDGNNVAHSLMLICTKLGMDFAIACPVGFEPDPAITKAAMGFAEESGAHILVTHDPREAAKGADAMYTDVWASMGQESQFEEKSKHFIPYQINDSLLECAKDDVIFMHCLPAHRGEEVTASVIDGPHSVVFDEAENRLHAQKAVMVKLMGKAEK